MVDISAIAGMVSALKGATDIAKAMKDIHDASTIQSKVIELQSKILDAQASAFAAQDERSSLIEKIRALEAEVAGLKQWDAGKDKYRLKDVGIGAFAYVPQPSADRSEPNHWLCVKCYGNRQRSILQHQGRSLDKRNSIYGCPTCKSTIQVHWSNSPAKAADEKSETHKAPGDVCPKCGKFEYRVERSEPHKEFGDMGGRTHFMKCGECSFEDEKFVG